MVEISNVAAVCRMPNCHGRIKPYHKLRGVCVKCGMDTDEFERLYRPEDWKIKQRLILEKLQGIRDATCGHVRIKVRE